MTTATVSRFKAWLRCRSEELAIRSALEHGCGYAFCITDGMFYVGEREELANGPMIHYKEPTK